MTRGRVSTVALGVLLFAGAAAAAIVLNLQLIGRASSQNDPVGRLTPRAALPAAPHRTVPPAGVRRAGGEGADD